MGSLDQAFSAEACSHPDSQLSLFLKEDGGGWDPALLKTGHFLTVAPKVGLRGPSSQDGRLRAFLERKGWWALSLLQSREQLPCAEHLAELAGVCAHCLAVILTGHTRAMAGGGAGARVLPSVSRLTLPTSAGYVQGPPRRHEAGPPPPGTVL